MSTASLRRDHELIEKVVRAMDETAKMLQEGKAIPAEILLQTIEFATDFTDVCHHGKEEDALFPALAEAGMPTKMGPIAVMLMEHEASRAMALRIKQEADRYINTGSGADLASAIREYVTHITEHLWKENNRLFMIADMRLGNADAGLDGAESEKLDRLGRTRQHYQKIAQNLEEFAASGQN